jgi:hypothetical protein
MATSNTPPSASAASSYILPSTHSSSPAGEISSLPSDDDESTIADENQHDSDAEREWRESLQQLELLLTMVVVPFVGKYFGRKTAYWGMFIHMVERTKDRAIANLYFLRVNRVGKVHAMELPSRCCRYKPRSIQGCWSSWCCGCFMIAETTNTSVTGINHTQKRRKLLAATHQLLHTGRKCGPLGISSTMRPFDGGSGSDVRASAMDTE